MKFVDNKNTLNPPVVYAIDHSKEVVLVLFLLFVWLCGFCYWPFHVEYCLALCSHVFSVLFSNVIISLGEERAGLSASHVSLFILHAFNFVLFLFLLVSACQGLAETCACGTPWTFLLTFLLHGFSCFFQSNLAL